MTGRLEGTVRLDTSEGRQLIGAAWLCAGLVGVCGASLGGPIAAVILMASAMGAGALTVRQWRRLARLSTVAIEPTGVRVADALVPWSDVAIEGAPTRTGLSSPSITIVVADQRLTLRPADLRNWAIAVSALRQRADPLRWRVQEVARGLGPIAAPTADAPVDTYRSSAGAATTALPAWLALRPRETLRWLGAGVLTIAIVSSLGLAGVIRAPRPPARARTFVPDGEPIVSPVGTLVGAACAIAAAVALAGAAQSASRDGRTRRLHTWLGPGVDADRAGNAVSADRMRRIRADARHVDSSGHGWVVLEELDASGCVRRTGIVRHRVGRVRVPRVLVRRVARLPSGAPPTRRHGAIAGDDLEVRIALDDAHVLVLDERDDGVLLTRFDDARNEAGSTWHASSADAERQIEDEYGARELPWREAPLDGGEIAFFAYA